MILPQREQRLKNKKSKGQKRNEILNELPETKHVSRKSLINFQNVLCTVWSVQLKNSINHLYPCSFKW